MCDLRVNEAKPTSRNVFIVNHFALESKKESKYDKKTFFWDSPQILDQSLNLSPLKNAKLAIFALI